MPSVFEKRSSVPQGSIFEKRAKEKFGQESIGSNIGRQIGRSGARIAETVLGAPRAIGEFGEMLVPEELLKKGAEKIGLREPVEKGLEFAKEYAPYKLFPKSEDVKEFNKFLFGKKVEPKNKWEERSDELISDFSALALPLPGSQLKFLKPALLAAGGNIASEIVGKFKGSEKEKTYAKLGTFLVGSLINPKSAEKFKNILYEEARSKIPEGATVSSTSLENTINTLEHDLRKGGIAGSDKEALQKIADIRSEMQGAQIPVDSLDRLKVKINEAKAGIYSQLAGNKPGIKSAKRNLESVGKSVDDALKLYGKQNPEWEALYRPANEVHGAIAQSHKVRNMIGRVAKKFGHHAVLPIFGISHLAGPLHTLEGLATTGIAGTAILTGGEIGARIWKSKTLRKLYMNTINSALKDDAVAIEQNLNRMEKALEKED